MIRDTFEKNLPYVPIASFSLNLVSCFLQTTMQITNNLEIQIEPLVIRTSCVSVIVDSYHSFIQSNVLWAA